MLIFSRHPTQLVSISVSQSQFARPLFFLLISALVSLASTPVVAQKKISHSVQFWMQSYQEAKINEKWTALLDGGIRWNDTFSMSAYIVRGGVGFQLSPKTRVAGGFAHMGSRENKRTNRYEYRPYQELSHQGTWGKARINHRLRVEERIFENRLDGLNNTVFRFRYAILFGFPLANLSSKNPDRKLILNIGDEIFLNAGPEHAHQTFDQNRLVISPTLQWNKDLSIALVYNSQLASTDYPDRFLLSHVAWLQTRYNLDLSRAPKRSF